MTGTSDRAYGSPAIPESWGPPQTKVVQWFDPSQSAAAVPTLSGLEFLRAILNRELPPPPIAGLFDMSLTVVEVGKVVFECEPGESAYNPIGTVHGGLMCTLLDSASACAIQTTLEPGFAYTSIDLNVSFLRSVTTQSGRLRATGMVTKPGRRVAFASAEITDSAGKVVASATTSCLVMDLRSRA
jgi:uncharacterized protein (TIGR00369 family)